MRIVYAFLVVVVSVILFMLPVSEAVYDFRTDLREDEFSSTTAVGQTTENVTLLREVYDDDTETISILSDDSDDSPAYSSYNTTSRQLGISGLADNLTRTLTVSYDVDALAGSAALNTFVGYIPWIWLLIIIVFPIAGLAAVFLGRAD